MILRNRALRPSCHAPSLRIILESHAEACDEKFPWLWSTTKSGQGESESLAANDCTNATICTGINT